jgi:AraC-like DNA-binding protein
MPLFMDYHKHVVATFDEGVLAHLQDLEVQAKFGVRYLKWWLNEGEGIIYCLIEAPDAESCQAVHRHSHGMLACSIVQVDPSFFNLFMGDLSRTKHDNVRTTDGSMDIGYRVILMLDVSEFSPQGNYVDVPAMQNPAERVISRHYGRILPANRDEKQVAVFNNAEDAIQCSLEIRDTLVDKVAFRIAVTAGKPVTEMDGFFSEALQLGTAMINLSSNSIVASSMTGKLGRDSSSTVRFLKPEEEGLLLRLVENIESNLSDEHFTVDQLALQMGISRPQLYRKVMSLTGKSPNEFIRNFRMSTARTLLRSRADNVSQIALTVGYNNPSYFARYFRETYGCTPSEYMSHQVAG